MITRFCAVLFMAALALFSSAQSLAGTYKGINEYIDSTVTITLNSNGKATMTTLKERRTNTIYGTFSGNTLNFGGAAYSVRKEGNGIRVTLKSNTRNTSYYARTGGVTSVRPGSGLGNVGSGGSRNNIQLGELYGTYSGFNARLDSDMTLTIDRDGDARAEMRKRSTGERRSLYGAYRNNVLKLDQVTYNTGKNKIGIFLQNANDPREQVQLYSGNGNWDSGGGNNGGWETGDRPPSWLVGTFSGFEVHNRLDVLLTVRSNGSAVADYTGADGYFRRYSGSYRSGKLVMNNATWNLTRGDWGFRATPNGDRDMIIEFKKGTGNTGSGGDVDSVPSWAVGTFQGKMAWARRDVTLTIRNNGSAVADYIYGNGQFERVSGSYRNSRLYLDGTDYRIERYGNGVRIIATDNAANSAVLSKDGTSSGDGGWDSNGLPSWLVGTFSGRRWDGAQMVLRVERDGTAVADYVAANGELERVTGNYHNGRLNLGKASYAVSNQSWGVRIVLSGTNNRADLYRK